MFCVYSNVNIKIMISCGKISGLSEHETEPHFVYNFMVCSSRLALHRRVDFMVFDRVANSKSFRAKYES